MRGLVIATGKFVSGGVFDPECRCLILFEAGGYFYVQVGFTWERFDMTVYAGADPQRAAEIYNGWLHFYRLQGYQNG